MDNNINELIKKAQSMIQNNEVPDDLKNIVNNFKNNNNGSDSSEHNVCNSSSANTYDNSGSSYDNRNSNSFNGLDIASLMKIQGIMSKLKNSDDDDMTRLLLSLKPYMRNEKKDKVDEYIQLIKMGKLTQVIESLGGEKNGFI